MSRLPIAPPVESRDGTVEKDGLCKNLLVEQDETAVYAALRPALSLLDTLSGDGNGIAEFNGTLVSVFGATLTIGATTSTLEDRFFDFAQSTL